MWIDVVQLQPGLTAGAWRLPQAPSPEFFPKAGQRSTHLGSNS